MSSIFGAKAGFHMNTNHMFPQDVLAIITLIGCLVSEDLKPVHGVGGSKACSRV